MTLQRLSASRALAASALPRAPFPSAAEPLSSPQITRWLPEAPWAACVGPCQTWLDWSPPCMLPENVACHPKQPAAASKPLRRLHLSSCQHSSHCLPMQTLSQSCSRALALPAGSLENDTYYCDYAIAPLNYFRANLTTVVGVPTAGECFITLCRWVDLGVRWC